jgi:hypothetical protein
MDDPTKDKLIEELAEELEKALSTIQNLTWLIKGANIQDHAMLEATTKQQRRIVRLLNKVKRG